MSLLSWRTIMRLSACVILTWTMVDLLAPELCAAEPTTLEGTASHESDGSPVRPDSDCFCCSHIVSPMTIDAVFVVGSVIAVTSHPPSDLSLGVLRSLFRPPLNLLR